MTVLGLLLNLTHHSIKLNALISPQLIERRIFLIRGHKVMLDSDLADLYQVSTKRLNEQVKRNTDRFPLDFMFQLTPEEFQNLKSQFATSRWGGRRTPPYAFTEHGTVMLASVLSSQRAIQVSIQIVRTFTRLRLLLSSHAGLSQKVQELEKKYDAKFKVVFEAIRQLMEPKEPPKDHQIGFQQEK